MNLSSSPPSSSRSVAAAAPSAISPASPSPPPTARPVSMSAAELRAAFSFLPSIHGLLTTMQYSSDSAQHSQHTAGLLSHFSSAHSLLVSLPAIAVSAAEQQAEYDRLCAVRDKKRELLRRYKIEVSDEGQRQAGMGAAVAQKTETLDNGGGTRAMEVGM